MHTGTGFANGQMHTGTGSALATTSNYHSEMTVIELVCVRNVLICLV